MKLENHIAGTGQTTLAWIKKKGISKDGVYRHLQGKPVSYPTAESISAATDGKVPVDAIYKTGRKGAARSKGDPYDLKKLRREAAKARNFPENTCGASRHLHMIADTLSKGETWGGEPEHMASSIYSVLISLWSLRTKVGDWQP